jgi:hypothetical protein
MMRRSVSGLLTLMNQRDTLTVITMSVNSHTTNLVGCKKTPKVVPPPALAPAQNVVDFANLASPSYTNFQSPLLYTYQ